MSLARWARFVTLNQVEFHKCTHQERILPITPAGTRMRKLNLLSASPVNENIIRFIVFCMEYFYVVLFEDKF